MSQLFFHLADELGNIAEAVGPYQSLTECLLANPGWHEATSEEYLAYMHRYTPRAQGQI